MDSDTIVAPATATGHAALAVVRVSGPQLGPLMERVVELRAASSVVPGRGQWAWFRDGEGRFDDGVSWFRPGPSTATGEDVLELHCHGNPLIVDRLVRACIDAGARWARPGEFTRRAVVNGRMDLVAAEGLDQRIRATTHEGLEVGLAGVDGRLASAYAEMRESLLQVGAELEARLDLPGDELILETDDGLRHRLDTVQQHAQSLAGSYGQGRLLVEGARVALVGAVNAGKSSLFNALLGKKRALVHASEGTTRDVLEVRTKLGPLEVTLLDTAGERVTSDPVEAAGLALARELVEEADLLVVVVRAAAEVSPTEQAILDRTIHRRRVVVVNGVDRCEAQLADAVATSAAAGEGLDSLRDAIVAALLPRSDRAEALWVASGRQRDLLLAVASGCAEAAEGLEIAGPAVASECVHEALAALDSITGADTREDVLSAIFSRFCIGK